MDALKEIIEKLELRPHPEGGYYRRTYKNQQGPHGRGHATAIYYLLEGREFARRHKLDADELWFWHAGAPLTLEIYPEDDEKIETLVLGPHVTKGESPQVLVPRHYWQRVRSEGSWTLVSCCVTPGFAFETFKMEEA